MPQKHASLPLNIIEPSDEIFLVGEARLDRLLAEVNTDLGAVNRLIVERMHSPVALIPQLAGHIIAAGGKRLRPMLTLAAAQLCQYSGNHHIILAACVEFIHTATLLHDDVVDHSSLRRGQPSANSMWGNKLSVLVGDFLFSRAFQLMVEPGSLEVLHVLSDTSARIAEGEVLQMVASNDTDATEATYLDIIGAKTACLFAAACEIGAIIADRPIEEKRALHDFGRNLGMAFQLIDDVLDYTAGEQKLGKKVGDDFREGKITLPVLLAIQQSDATERAFWIRVMEQEHQKKNDLQKAIMLMQHYNTFALTKQRALLYAKQADIALAIFPFEHPLRQALHDVVSFSIIRTN